MFPYLGAFGGLLCVISALFFVHRLVSDHRYSDGLLNASAGIAVAYAFVDVFPHLARKQLVFDGFYSDNLLGYLSHHLYLVALIGFCVCVAARAAESAEAGRTHGHFTHWLLSLLLCLYGVLLGYMLAEQPVHRPEPALLFGLAMGAHLLGLGHELRDQAPRLYDRVIRYLLMASVAVGWVWGYLADFSERTYGLWFAFIAGSIVASGTVSDLPRISTTRAIPTFFAGALGYTVLLLLVENLSA